MKIIYSPTFKKKYKKLSPEIKLLAEKKEIIFRKDPFDKSLETHKLHGQFKDSWAFSINREYRIVFDFYTKNVVWFNTVGTHEEVYK